VTTFKFQYDSAAGVMRCTGAFPDSGPGIFVLQSAPSSPPGAGTIAMWGDTTNATVEVEDSSGNISSVPRQEACTNQVVTGLGTNARIACAAVTEAMITLANNTTNNVSTTKHGFAPILPNDATKYLDGTGAYSVPAGGGSSGFRASCPYSTFTMTGSDVTICTFSGVTLAAGQCAEIKAHVLSSPTGGNWTGALKVAGSAISTFSLAGQATHFFFTISYCNDSGVQNAQHYGHTYGSYVVTYAGGNGQFSELRGGGGTSSVDFSTAKTITLTANEGSDTFTLYEATIETF
jgi:hypothetical protein